MTAAYLTVTLLLGRLMLDAMGIAGWRQTPMRWVPHLNDTVLLAAAIGLLGVGGWNPLEQSWLAVKLALLCGYICAGVFALKPSRGWRARFVAAVAALVQVILIICLATTKPGLF
ncbi:invasion protein [Marinobacter sp. X15-166B]|nr:invasion protein [Marinobacter sp. X15-166B]